MASTSVTLGNHWDEFIKTMLKEGRYGSASELMRAGLRLLEEQDGERARLRVALMEGEAQADSCLDELARALRLLADNLREGVDCMHILPGTRRLIVGRHARSTE